MHSFTLLSAVAGVSLALANPLAAPVAAPLITAAPLARMVKPALERRQTGIDECMSKADSIWSDAPQLEFGDPLASWFQSQGDKIQTVAAGDVGGMCSIIFPATIDAPGPISSAYASFTSASVSWASKIKPTVTSLAQSCGGMLSAGLEVVLATDFDSCTSLYGVYMAAVDGPATSSLGSTGAVSPPATEKSAPTGSTSLQPTETGSSSDATNTSASSSQSTAGAPRETGYAVAAAAAVVAVAGAMVAL